MTSLSDVNEALSKVLPVETLPGSAKLPYGQKEKSIREQNAKWTPHQFVPDKFPLATVTPRLSAASRARQSTLGVSRGGRLIPQSRRQKMADARAEQAETAGAEETGTESALKKPRYSKHVHKAVFVSALRAPPFNGVLPKKKDQLELLASNIRSTLLLSSL